MYRHLPPSDAIRRLTQLTAAAGAVAVACALPQCSSSSSRSPANSIIVKEARAVESAGFARIILQRNSFAAGVVSVRYTTVDATATAPQDYEHTEGTVTWSESDTTEKTISIAVVDDPWIEATEQFALRVLEVTGGVYGGTGDIAITIEDNDGPVQPDFASNHRLLAAAAGDSTDAVGDLDGDGLADFCLGDAKGNSGAGRVLVICGRAGNPIFDIAGAAGEGLGALVAGIGDVDGDGSNDFAAYGGRTTPAAVRVFSGKDGRQLYQIDGSTTDPRSVGAMRGITDVDGDGRPDFVLGYPTDSAQQPAFVAIRSGADGRSLREIAAGARGEGFGSSLARIPDLDADGVGEFLVGAPTANGATQSGAAYLFSGKTGQLIERLTGPTQGSGFGTVVVSTGDVDGDGRPDIAVGAPLQNSQRGAIYLYSGADRVLLFTWNGEQVNGLLGAAIAAADWDEDGRSDIVAGIPGVQRVVAFSGMDGRAMLQFDGTETGFGKALTMLDDTNGDGSRDLLVASDASTVLLSAARLPLAADVSTISVAQPGKQTLSLAAGARHAGLFYLIGGSLGTTPGLDIGNVHVPLNDDVWLDIVLRYRNTPLFQRFLGNLDGDGKATASVNTPVVTDPRAIGLSLNLAYLVFDGSGTPRFSSNAVPLRFVE